MIRFSTLRSVAPYAKAAALLLLFGIASCNNDRTDAQASQNNVAVALNASSLGRDLRGQTREQVFRACSYLRRSRKMDIPEANPQTVEAWRDYGNQVADWLAGHDLPLVVQLIEGYPFFVVTWAPYYQD